MVSVAALFFPPEILSLEISSSSSAGGPDRQAVLLGWELGGGLGHVQRLLPLAHGLARHGHRPVLVVKNLVDPWPALRGEPFPILQAPSWPARFRDEPSFLAASYADILAIRGYAAVDDLLPLVNAWQGLIDLVRPGLVVGDHSPTLCLAAYGSVPTVLVGTGFTMPPASVPTFPMLLLQRTPRVPEDQLLAVVQEVQRRRQRPAPNTLPGLFAAADRFLTVLPELDPYRPFRTEPHLGPIEGLPPGPLPSPAVPHFFGYLSASASKVEALVAALARAGLPGTVYVRGAGPAMCQALRPHGLEILDGLAPLAEMLQRATVIVHHAGTGISQMALAAGRPQLLLPTSLEQFLNAELLQQRGVGRYLTGAGAVEAVGPALRQVADPAYVDRARLAQELQARSLSAALPVVLERCLSLLRS